MKKITTLAFMAFFVCLGAMAQVELGDIHFSIANGKKVNPNNGKITVTFPNVTGVEDPTATTFVLEGNFGNEDLAFDGVEGTFAEGITFDLVEFELQPSTEYTLNITSVKVNGVELAAEGGYALDFKTRGTERKTSWTFQIDQETKDKIIADDGNDPAFNESNGGTYWKCIKTDERHFIHQTLRDSEIMLDADNILPVTEDLTFTAGTDKMFVGDLTGSFAGLLVFNATNLTMTIPDCKVGDVITFNGVNATKGQETAQINISGGYLDVTVSANGDTDGIDSNGSYIQSGGIVITRGPSSEMAAAIDADGRVSISGGTLIILGYGRVSASGNVKQYSLSLHSSGSHSVTIGGTSYTFTNAGSYGSTSCYSSVSVK